MNGSVHLSFRLSITTFSLFLSSHHHEIFRSNCEVCEMQTCPAHTNLPAKWCVYVRSPPAVRASISRCLLLRSYKLKLWRRTWPMLWPVRGSGWEVLRTCYVKLWQMASVPLVNLAWHLWWRTLHFIDLVPHRAARWGRHQPPTGPDLCLLSPPYTETWLGPHQDPASPRASSHPHPTGPPLPALQPAQTMPVWDTRSGLHSGSIKEDSSPTTGILGR